MNCWHCNTELIWGGDHDLDMDMTPEYSIVTNLTCPLGYRNCRSCCGSSLCWHWISSDGKINE